MKEFLAWFGSTRAGAWIIINIGTRVDRWLIRVTNGSFNSTFAWPCLLLTTKGARSGARQGELSLCCISRTAEISC